MSVKRGSQTVISAGDLDAFRDGDYVTVAISGPICKTVASGKMMTIENLSIRKMVPPRDRPKAACG